MRNATMFRIGRNGCGADRCVGNLGGDSATKDELFG